MKLAITIDVDGDIMYVPESTHGFVNHPKPKLFDNIEDAEEERKKWNTGVIIDYETGLAVPVIRAFDDDERLQAQKRRSMNNGE